MSKGTSFKSVVVKEDPKTSLAEAGIYPLKLEDGRRAVAIGHLYFPNHDRSMFEVLLQYLRDTKPDVVFLLGGMVDEDAFKALIDQEDSYLHELPDAPEIEEARQEPSFEKMVLALGKTLCEFIKSIQKASTGLLIYIPSATHESMSNEVRLMEYIQFKKRALDSWSDNHPDASDLPNDPSILLPRQLSKLLDLEGEANIRVLRYGASVLVNDNTLFMIGDFRRRNAGDASKTEWEQRRRNIVRSFDGKVASNWMTTPNHTMTGLKLNFWQFHEVGYLWDETRMGHLRDYDRRAPGFWTGVILGNELFGQSIPIIRGDDGRRSFVVDCVPYTEKEPGGLPHGETLTLEPVVATSPVTPRPSKARKTKGKSKARRSVKRYPRKGK